MVKHGKMFSNFFFCLLLVQAQTKVKTVSSNFSRIPQLNGSSTQLYSNASLLQNSQPQPQPQPERTEYYGKQKMMDSATFAMLATSILASISLSTSNVHQPSTDMLHLKPSMTTIMEDQLLMTTQTPLPTSSDGFLTKHSSISQSTQSASSSPSSESSSSASNVVVQSFNDTHDVNMDEIGLVRSTSAIAIASSLSNILEIGPSSSTSPVFPTKLAIEPVIQTAKAVDAFSKSSSEHQWNRSSLISTITPSTKTMRLFSNDQNQSTFLLANIQPTTSAHLSPTTTNTTSPFPITSSSALIFANEKDNQNRTSSNVLHTTVSAPVMSSTPLLSKTILVTASTTRFEHQTSSTLIAPSTSQIIQAATSATNSSISSKKTKTHCPSVKINAGEKGLYNVQRTPIGEMWRYECYYGGINPSSKANMICGKNGLWGDLDTSLCLTKLGVKNIIHEVGRLHQTLTVDNSTRFAHFLATSLRYHREELIKVSSNLQVIFEALQTLFNVVQNKNSREKNLSNLFNILSEVVQVPANFFFASVFKSQLQTMLRRLKETFRKENPTFEHFNKNMALSVHQLKDNSTNEFNITFKNQLSPSTLISLDKTTPSIQTIEILAYKNTTLYPTKLSEGRHLISDIISLNLLTVGNIRERRDSDHTKRNNMTLSFVFLVEPSRISPRSISKCVAWNSNEDVWSTESCTTYPEQFNLKTNDIAIPCECHFHAETSQVFAVIGDVISSPSAAGYSAMFHFVAFLCVLFTLLFLGVTTITYVAFRALRKERNSKIIIFQCLSLIMVALSFVAALTFVKKETLCFIVGRFLHYFILTSFSWMFIQSILLYRAIVVISLRRMNGLYFKAIVLACSVGALTFTVIGGNFEKDKPPPQQICFVSGMNFYLTVLFPSILLIILTVSFFVPVFKNVFMLERMMKNSIEAQRDEDFKRAQSAFIINVVIITSWVCGMLGFYFDSMVVKYVFCGCLVVCGCVVFYLHVFLNKDALLRLKKANEHCCSKNYRVKDEKVNGVEDEKVKLRAKDSFHFNETIDRNKRSGALLSDGWV
ncbi:adhesion G-protein coupled receptor G6-like isoform X2 [Clytia hemisphaerica]|uniref:Uncharacterized protein n=2 Tax=Clytia hemisphaerica TaxID=252671 RepID=A0A7M5UN92_9CNID